MTLYKKSDSRIQITLKSLSTRIFWKIRKYWHNFSKILVASGLKKKPRAIFVVGSGRSGTDILVDCLDHLMNVKTINEYSELAFARWRLKELSFVKDVIESSGSSFVTLKPIVETMRIKELLDYFPDSKGVFIFRNYNDAINSQVRFFGEDDIKTVQNWIDSNFEEFPQVPEKLRIFAKEIWENDKSNEAASGIYWLIYNSSYLYLELNRDDRVSLVQYDKLVANPEPTLRLLCSFLGIPYKKSMHSNIYSSSVSRHTPPKLPAKLQQKCDDTWQLLKQHSLG